MQSLRIPKGKMIDRVEVPPSKSYANRVLILASLTKHPFTLHQMPDASDVTNLTNALKAIGLKFTGSGKSLTITNSFPECEHDDPKPIETGEGGTTARFLATMLLLGKKKYTLILGKRLKERPWKEFIDLATRFGASVELVDNKLMIQGPANFPSEIEVDCSNTTQFATGFQLLKVAKNINVIPVNLDSSQSYWEMTASLVKSFSSVSAFTVPLDWSSASYPMAFAALNHEISFPGLQPDTNQADSKFFKILSDYGAITIANGDIKVSPGNLQKEFQIDVSDCLDLVPTLVYFLAHIKGKHSLKGVQNLIHKESNRLDEVIKLAKAFDRVAHSDGKTLIVEGASERRKEQVHLVMPDDHRMVMAGTLFLLHHAGGTVSPKEAVMKSYPDFFKLIYS